MPLPSLAALDQYSVTGPPPGSGPDDPRTFYSPVDNDHAVLTALVESATTSLVVAMYGFDDQALADMIARKLASTTCFVSLTLDSSQASGAHERAILAAESYPASSIAVGRSEKGAIMHMKVVIVDGLDVADGSTNWSAGGESLQDNQLSVTRDMSKAALARARIDAIHNHMLQATGSSGSAQHARLAATAWAGETGSRMVVAVAAQGGGGGAGLAIPAAGSGSSSMPDMQTGAPHIASPGGF
jgi:phosphatidylserine/phosphatidylglycerophosphate/cardiolipin synthase-like enzyme